MFTIKSLKILVIALVLALPLSACGQRAPLEPVDGAIIDSASF